MQRSQSKEYFERAKAVIPGGVNSPVRAFRSVGMEPAFIARAEGSKLYDVDGNTYIDFIGSWGPMILGHAHPKVVAAVKAVIGDGTSYGAPTLREVELAELIVDCVPSIAMLRLVSSGTEAVMSAVRLARGFTGREKIIKFEGCYHGHSDGLLVKAGSGAMTTGVPDSSGVPESFARHTLCAPYNDLQAVESLFAAHNGEVAAVIVEPVAANMGVVAPKPGYLEGLRKLCDKAGALLIFDEVISGFRMALGGAQSYYGVLPDLTVFGKIIGGGLPIGAYGGKKEIMTCISPLGKVYQAGTLSGNPVATMAGIQTLRLLKEHPEIYPALEKKAMRIESAFLKAAENSGMPLQLNRVGSLLCAFFTAQPVTDYATALTADVDLFKRFFQKMFYRGFYIAPSQFEAWFFSAAHTDEELESTCKAISEVFEALGHEG